MKIVGLVLTYLSGILVSSSGEQDVNVVSTASTTTIDPVPSPAVCNDVQSCECTLVEFQNVQNNLDSCLVRSDNTDKEIISFQEQNAILTSAMETMEKKLAEKTKEEAEWVQEKKELHILINDLQKNIDEKKAIVNELRESNADYEALNNSLEQKINSIESSNEETTATIKNQLLEATTKIDQRNKNIETMKGQIMEVTEKLASAEEKKSKIVKKHDIKVKEMRTQISNINKELKQKETSLRSMQDRYHDAREEVTDLGRQLGSMHIKARTTYFNSTLVKEDAVKFLNKNLDKSIHYAEDAISHPKVQDTYKKVKSTLADYLSPLAPTFEKYVSPQIEIIGKKMKDIDAIEGVRLLVISLIEQGSTIGLNYVELTKDNSFGARRMQLKVSRMCTYTKKNAENITHSAFQLIAAYLSYRLVFLLLKTIIVGIVKMMQGKKSKVVVTEKTI
jgi:DNA repair exonuclease SbcCD ATPase subunit